MVSYDDLDRAIAEMKPDETLTIHELYMRAAALEGGDPVWNSLVDAGMYYDTDEMKMKLAPNQLTEVVAFSHGPDPVPVAKVEKVKLSTARMGPKPKAGETLRVTKDSKPAKVYATEEEATQAPPASPAEAKARQDTAAPK
jgi:hypothetical protein